MKLLLPLWNPTPITHSLFPLQFPSFSLPLPLPAPKKHTHFTLRTSPNSTATQEAEEEEEEEEKEQEQQQLSGRERRKLRNERRENKSGYSWREEVEERLIKKPKKKYVPKSAELNLDNLSFLGPQWWVFKVSRVRGYETAQLVARLLARNYPQLEFKIYAPSVHVKRKLKNGTFSVKPKPLFPGCVFLWCVMNKEIHDFIRECEGVGGFVGAKVGYAKRQITKPRPVDDDDMEEIFRQAKEEQQKHDEEFEDQQGEKEEAESFNMNKFGIGGVPNPPADSKLGRGSIKIPDPLPNVSLGRREKNLLTPGSTVRIVSGTFADFKGTLRKLNRRSGKATVVFTLLGKESLVDLDLAEIAVETE